MSSSVVERPVLAHILIILASFICSLGVWIVVKLETTEEITVPVAIQLRDLEEYVEQVKGSPPLRTEVVMAIKSGEKSIVKSYNYTLPVSVGNRRAELERELTFRRTFKEILQPNMLHPSDDKRYVVRELNPMEVQVELQLRRRQFRITPKAIGNPAPFHQVTSMSIVDEAGLDADSRRRSWADLTVLLTEEKAAQYGTGVDSAPPIWVDVPLDGQKASFTVPVQVVLEPGMDLLMKDKHLLKGAPASASESNTEFPVEKRFVRVEIREEVRRQTVENVPITYTPFTVNQDIRFQFDPPVVNVVLSGPHSAIEAFKLEHLRFPLYGVSEIAGEQREIKVTANIDEQVEALRGLVVVDVIPSIVSVTTIVAAKTEAPKVEEPSDTELPTTSSEDKPTTP